MKNKVTTVVFIGAHGSGKTTLGRKLAYKMKSKYHEEIGRLLRKKALAKNKDNHALKSQPDFDKKVIQAELNRDKVSKFSRIVETWHPGNLAYAYLRSPNIAMMYENTVREKINSINQKIIVQPLRISVKTIHERLSEPGSNDVKATVRFFNRVAKLTEKIAKTMGLTVLKPIYTDVFNEEETLKTAISNLSDYGITFTLS